MQPTPPHWLKPNHVTRLPRRFICLDTEAITEHAPGRQVQTFRCAVAVFDHQDKKGAPPARAEWLRSSSLADTWAWVDARTHPRHRTVLVCHNLAYDLRILDAFRRLPELGWSLSMVRLGGDQAWCEWKRDGRTLLCVDSVAWFGVGIAALGELVGIAKPDLPGDDADEATWFARCEADVTILRAAWHRVMGWIESEDLGTFKPTGAGQGWAAFRHRWMDTPILHHGIDHIAESEREAAYAGRCEAWVWGQLGPGPWHEWDFHSAYAHIAEDCDVPTRLIGHSGARGAYKAISGSQGVATLIRATVTLSEPVLPVRGPHGILWPIGTITGWWWDVELDLAEREGATIEAHEGWRYEARPALRTWARWVLDTLDAPATVVDPVCRAVVKGWSRTVVGRFGSRWSTFDPIGEAMPDGWMMATARRAGEAESFRLLSVAGTTWAETHRHDSPDSAVHVMSWIMAATRVRLWAAMRVAGLDTVAYVDTDGLMVSSAGSERLSGSGLPGLRLKSAWRHVEILGPRQLVLEGRLKAAGVPSKATREGEHDWRADVWRSLPVSLAHGESDRVVITERTYNLVGTDHRRAHDPGGRTSPLAVTPGELAGAHVLACSS